MIHIVEGQEPACGHLLQSMYADRKRLFVDLLGWDVPVVAGRFEIDQFDDEHAIYLIAADPDGQHMGSLRLLPSHRPHILGTIFPHLCPEGVPVGPEIFEITRLCLPVRHGTVERLRIRNRLISAMVDHALDSGIRTLTGVVEAGFLAQVLTMGWRCSTPTMIRATTRTALGSFRVEIEPDTPGLLAANGIYTTGAQVSRSAAWRGLMADLSAPALTPHAIDPWSDRLRADGYCIIPDVITPDCVAALNRALDARFADTPFCDGGFYGRRTKRFGGVLKHAAGAEILIQHPTILAIVERALTPWCDRMNLNLTQAIEIHPHALAQFPHRDQDMWPGPKGEIEYLVNVMWPLTPFTADNGATLIWPGSHRDQVAGPEAVAPIAAEMAPGSVLLFLGSTLHGGGGNRTQRARRGLIVSYCLGWLKPFENQWLVYPPSIARRFDSELAALVGYSQHRPNLGNYEGQCPSVLLRDKIPEHLAATDALLPDQQAALEAYVADQANQADASAAAMS